MKHKVEEVTLKNGARGLLIDVPGATVMNFDFQLNAGDYLCPIEKVETAHLMEHMLFQANQKFAKGRDFQAELEKNGAMYNASTNAYSVNYIMECADFEWDRVLPLLGTAITKPVFKQSEFKAEYGNVKEELNIYLNNHFRQLSLRLSEAMGFYVQNETKRLQNMPNVKMADIAEHYKKTHKNENLHFIIGGRIRGRKTQMIKILESSFKLPKGERIELPDEEPNKLDNVLYVPRKNVDNLYFIFDTYTDRALSHVEVDALALINTMLTETLDSNIFGKAREKGLAYSVSSGLAIHYKTTGWWMGAQIMPENSKKLFKIIHQELERLLSGQITVKEIEAAKQYRLGEFQRGTQTIGGLTGGYAKRYFTFDRYSNYSAIPDRIKALDKKKVVDVARKMFAEDIWGMAVLGNCGKEFAEELHAEIAPLWDRGRSS